MIRLTIPVPLERIRILQDLVKAVEGRFAPFVPNGNLTEHLVKIEFMDSGSYALFCETWNRWNTNFTETAPSWYVRLFRKVIGRLK